MNLCNKSAHIISPHLLLIRLHFLLFLLISISEFPLTSHGCHEHERRALIDFKSSLVDPSNRLSSWQEGSQHENCCRWHGIECSHDSFHVISIKLRNTFLETYSYEHHYGLPPQYTAALHGKFSHSIFNITHLKYLDLSFNNFQESQIPLQLSHLTELTHLDLSYSNFSASISTQFTNLTSLRYLDLSCIRDYFHYHTSCVELSSIKWVRGLKNLKALSLRGVHLFTATNSQKNLADHISYLASLKYLDISYCFMFTTIFPISNFHNLSRLSVLKMSHNNIIGGPYKMNYEIPFQIANLTSLSILDLSGCGLQGSVPYLPQLTELDVSDNSNLRPDLTKMFQRQWSKLQRLSISDTNVNGSIPISISNAPLLVTLSAHSSSLQGYIPISICEIPSLQELDLSNNNITGALPSCFTELKNLTFLEISRNSIGGTISLINFINELNLTYLDLSSNRLTVVIDQRFHLYSKFKLEYLALPSCNLKGIFPTFICKLPHLYHLDLSDNYLEGVIPSYCISKLQISGSFNLSNNKLHGPLPLLPQGLYGSRSTTIDLSNSKLSGKISTENGKRLSSFHSINLAGNYLSGSIPLSICLKDSGSSPTYIDFSNNNLSGIIPTTIGYCSDLEFLNLGSNNLTGNAPSELEHAKFLIYLQLHENNLDGTLPDFFSKLQDLKVLNLANNNFGGSIPTSLGSIMWLRILSLRSNKLNGTIPREIFNSYQLQILDLSQNALSGHIPKILGMYWKGLASNYESFSNPDDIQLGMVIKGIMIQFEKLYNYSSGIDLSHNMLDGNIPTEVGFLKQLATLNLSHNNFTDSIPLSMGNMSSLGSLDLSFNSLSGHIPQSLTSLDFLGVLNLSYNELSGRIPRGTHFDTVSIDGWVFVGNDLLCGVPLKKVCEGDQANEVKERDKEDVNERILFYGVIALGFGVGFWGLFFVLLLKRRNGGFHIGDLLIQLQLE